MVFATFGAEEMGLVGSKYLSENPPFDLSEDSGHDQPGYGRADSMKNVSFKLAAWAPHPDLRALLDSLNKDYGFSLKFSNEGYGPSDHAAFYAKDVPVLFISTGAHARIPHTIR